MRPLLFTTIIFLLPACAPGLGEGKTASECVDGEDNDGDGDLDCADAGCADYDFCGGDTADTTDTGTPMVEDPELCINEFMASNAMTVPDESGAYPDWIELYNLTDQAMDLAGYTITDDLENPGKHVLGEGLAIEPGGFVMLWADGDVDQGANHLSFKLSKAGEELGIYRPDGGALDRLRYAAQATDMSAARMPDGSESWEIDDTPTPGEPNG